MFSDIRGHWDELFFLKFQDFQFKKFFFEPTYIFFSSSDERPILNLNSLRLDTFTL